MQELHTWERLRRGDRAALRELYESYYEVLHNYGCRMTPHPELVEDCIQDLFVELWRLRDRLNATNSVKNYLLGSFRNNLVKMLQRVNRHSDELSLDFELRDEGPHAEEKLMQGESETEWQAKLDAAMQKLSYRQREAIYLRYQEGMSYEQICEVMQLQYQSVRNLISNGVKKLKEILLFLLIFIWNVST